MQPQRTDPFEANQRLIAEFVAQADVTDATRAKYRAHLGELATWLARDTIAFERVESGDLVRYMTYLRAGDRFAARPHHRVTGALSASARKNVLASIHSFYRYLRLMGAVQVDPSAPIRPPKVQHRPGLVLTAHELRAILEIPGGTPRERVQVYILAYTAARSEELRRLRWCDVDLANATMFLTGKGGKARVVDIHPRLMSELRRWYIHQDDQALMCPAIRHAKSDPNTDFVLLTRSGRPIAKTVIAKQLKARAIRAGVRVRLAGNGERRTDVSPHALRRTFATVLLERGEPIDAIADVLGHVSIDTTRQHYAFASNARRRSTILAFAPQDSSVKSPDASAQDLIRGLRPT